MPSKSLEALSIVVQHETNEILVDQTSLKQQKMIEQHRYWTKLNPGEIFILASIVKKCLQQSRFSDEYTYGYNCFPNIYGTKINFGKIAKCLATRGFYSKIYLGQDLPGQDYWVIGWNVDNIPLRMEEPMNGIQNFTFYHPCGPYDPKWEMGVDDLEDSEHSDDSWASDDHWSHTSYRRGCILCENHFDMACSLHTCDHEFERDCNDDCNDTILEP
jgi:hypothetical protein